jgi:hypothetical protein
VVPGAELRRRHAEEPAEGAGERFVGAVAGGEGDLEDALARGLEVDGGGLEAQAADVLADRLADEGGEDPVKVEGPEVARRARRSRDNSSSRCCWMNSCTVSTRWQ